MAVKNAYVTAIENDANEIKGALVIALALRMQDPRTKRICLVPPAIPLVLRRLLGRHFDVLERDQVIYSRSSEKPYSVLRFNALTVVDYRTVFISPKLLPIIPKAGPPLRSLFDQELPIIARLSQTDDDVDADVDADDERSPATLKPKNAHQFAPDASDTDLMVNMASEKVFATFQRLNKATREGQNMRTPTELILAAYGGPRARNSPKVNRPIGLIAPPKSDLSEYPHACLQSFSAAPWLLPEDGEAEAWHAFAKQLSLDDFEQDLRAYVPSGIQRARPIRSTATDGTCGVNRTMLYVHNAFDRTIGKWLNKIPYMLIPVGNIADMYCTFPNPSLDDYTMSVDEAVMNLKIEAGTPNSLTPDVYGRLYLLTNEQYAAAAKLIENTGYYTPLATTQAMIGPLPQRISHRLGVLRSSIGYSTGAHSLFNVLMVAADLPLERINCTVVSVNGATRMAKGTSLADVWAVTDPSNPIPVRLEFAITDSPFVETDEVGTRIITDEIRKAIKPSALAAPTINVPQDFYSWFWSMYIPSLQENTAGTCGLRYISQLIYLGAPITESATPAYVGRRPPMRRQIASDSGATMSSIATPSITPANPKSYGYISPNPAAIEEFRACVNDPTKRFAIMMVAVGIAEQSLAHQCLILYDRTHHALEFFDPWGADSYLARYVDADDAALTILRRFAKDVGLSTLSSLTADEDTQLTYYSPLDYCPRLGPQSIELQSRTVGYCQWWTMWYAELRVTNPSVPRDEILTHAIRRLKQFGADEFIQRYGHLLIKKCIEMFQARTKLALRVELDANYFPFKGLTRSQLDEFTYGYCETIANLGVIMTCQRYGVTPYHIPFNNEAYAQNKSMPLFPVTHPKSWSPEERRKYITNVVSRWPTNLIIEKLTTVRYYLDAGQLSQHLDSDQLVFKYPNGFEPDPNVPNGRRTYWDMQALCRNTMVMSPSIVLGPKIPAMSLFIKFPQGLPKGVSTDGAFIYAPWDFNAISSIRTKPCGTSAENAKGTFDDFFTACLDGQYESIGLGLGAVRSDGSAASSNALNMYEVTRNPTVTTACIKRYLRSNVWDLRGLYERIADVEILAFLVEDAVPRGGISNAIRDLGVDVERVSRTIRLPLIEPYLRAGGRLNDEALSGNSYITREYVEAHPEFDWNRRTVRNQTMTMDDIMSLIKTGTCPDADVLDWERCSAALACTPTDNLVLIFDKLDYGVMSRDPKFRLATAELIPHAPWDWRGIGRRYAKMIKETS